MSKGNGKKVDKPEVGTLPERLTDKQRRFVEEYLVDFNATQAAIRAGYSENSARQQGSDNLSKPYIRGAIDQRMNELTMSAAEAAMRLTRWGRGSVASFLRITADGEAVVDLSTAEAQAALDLVRKIRQTEKTVRSKDGTEYTTVKTQVELHDAKDAVIQMAKLHAMFRDEGEADSGVLTQEEMQELYDAFERVEDVHEFERLLVAAAQEQTG